MSAKKPNISQIDQYLKGKLDARAMHKLEQQAQDDPFLMDALEGYEQSGKDQQANLAQLKEQLANRVAPAKQRSIILWRVLPLAASVILMLGIGYWIFKPEPVKKQYANVIPTSKPQQEAIASQPFKEPTIIKQKDVVADVVISDKKAMMNEAPMAMEEPIIANTNKANTMLRSEGIISNIPNPIYKKDTTEYLIRNYKLKPNAQVENVLKKMVGIDVSPEGSVTFQGNAVTKVRLNGKNFSGGDVAAATKSLPADILQKIQIINDYGEQATKAGVKTGNPTTVLNLITDTLNNQNLIAANRPAPMLREVSIASPVSIQRVGGITTTTNNVANRLVSGKVLDDRGNPLIGATVKVDGANNGVNTDVNGNFKINLPSNKDLLAVNFIGYNPKQVKVGDQKDLKIALNESQTSLNEVVVASYGTQKKQTPCTENPEFKKLFFDRINTVEKFTVEQITATKHTITEKAFKKSLEFLAKYTKVSTDKAYKDMGAYLSDRNVWLNWYEANKCNDLK